MPDLADDVILCDTIRRFKGLERPVVVLVELRADDPRLARLLYVGASRARQHLVVIGSAGVLQALAGGGRGGCGARRSGASGERARRRGRSTRTWRDRRDRRTTRSSRTSPGAETIGLTRRRSGNGVDGVARNASQAGLNSSITTRRNISRSRLVSRR